MLPPFVPMSDTPLISSPETMIFVSAVSESSPARPGPISRAVSVYSPGETSVRVKWPFSPTRLPPPKLIMKVPPSPLVSTIDTNAPVSGRPCESTAVPVIRAVRTGSSAKLMPVTSDPTSTLTFSACCSLGVPGKYVAA